LVKIPRPKTYCAATDLAPLLDGSTAGELIPELARYGLQQLIELEVAAVLGADRHERTEERLCYRNGYRPRSLTTQVGDIDLLISKLRAGSFLPSILEPRRRVEQQQLILHADNGTAVRGATLESRPLEMGMLRFFLRPRALNDNPYSESLF
jgi:hypothetical protein